MPIDKNLVNNQLSQLENLLRRIENMDIAENELLENLDIQDLLTFRLQQAVEICIDIATHLISGLALEKSETARSSFEVLAKNKIIGADLAEKLGFAVSFRNLAVHGYDKFDFSRLFRDYKEDVDDLKIFMTEIVKYINSAV